MNATKTGVRNRIHFVKPRRRQVTFRTFGFASEHVAIESNQPFPISGDQIGVHVFRAEWGFPGLKPGDKWCVCVTRWKSALAHNRAAPVDLEGTHASALEFVTLEELKAYALK